MLKFKVFALITCFFFTGCASIPGGEKLAGPELGREEWDKPSEVFEDLQNLPQARGKIIASVYSFRDLTGQYKQSPSSSFSTAVSQGAASMLVKAVKDSQWFAPVEREGLQDLLTERKIIRAAIKNKNQGDVAPLLGANVLLEGGIIGYETNMKTGGRGAKYFGIGISEQYRVDQVSVNLRVVDVGSGRVINSVTTSRSILSRQIQGGAFRYVRFKRLLEMEGGYTRNEPVHLCLLEAIQEAVIKIVVEGVEDRSWALNSAHELGHPLIEKYGRGLKQGASIASVGAMSKKPQVGRVEGKARVTSKPTHMAAVKNEVKKENQVQEKTEKLAMKVKNERKPGSKINTTVITSKPLKVTAAAVSLKNKAHVSKANISHAMRGKQKDVAVNQHKELIQKKDGEWVIQLMASNAAMDLVSFVRENKIKRSMIEYIHYQKKGQDRFAILYGRFASKTQAIKAIESLPPRLRIFEPSVRSRKKA